jgi:hypothetical protein
MPARDLRPYIYAGIDQLMVVAYAYVLVAVIPNRLPLASLHLWSIPVATQVMALGTATAFRAWRLRRIGWWVAVVGGSVMLLSTIVLLLRIVVSAAYLSGVYGAFGEAAWSAALIGAALVVEVVALLPLVQVKYLMSRAGRRAFAT